MVQSKCSVAKCLKEWKEVKAGHAGGRRAQKSFSSVSHVLLFLPLHACFLVPVGFPQTVCLVPLSAGTSVLSTWGGGKR